MIHHEILSLSFKHVEHENVCKVTPMDPPAKQSMKRRSDRQRSTEEVPNAQDIAKSIAQQRKQRSTLRSVNSDILKKVGAYHSASRSLDEKAGRIHSSSVGEKNSEQADEEAGQDANSESESPSESIAHKEEEEQDSGDDVPPRTIDEFLDTVTEKTGIEYIVHESFFNIVISANYEEIFLWLSPRNMKELFFHQLTVDGVEGALPDMFDTTPKMAGLYFDVSPNGMDIVLFEAQQELSSSDLAASMYDQSTKGMKRGILKYFKPLFQDEENEEVLIDVSDWLLSFATFATFGPPSGALANSHILLETRG